MPPIQVSISIDAHSLSVTSEAWSAQASRDPEFAVNASGQMTYNGKVFYYNGVAVLGTDSPIEGASYFTIATLEGTSWVIKEIPGKPSSNSTANINFVSNNTNFTAFKLNSSAAYWFDEYGIIYGDTPVYGEGSGWANQAYRTIEITGGTDATDADLIVWLMNNATQQTPVVTPNEYALTHSLTNLTHGNISLTITPDTNYELPSSVTVTNGTLVSYDSSTGIVVISGDDTTTVSVTCEAGVVIDPVLANNSWDVIKQVCQSGDAADYWALGDTKNISVTISGTPTNIPHAIVDMTASRYEYASDNTKHSNVVFQAVPTIGDFQFNPSSNTNANGAYNTWYTSDLRTSMNSGTIYGLYDSSFTSLLEEVQTYEALDGTTAGNVVQYQADKLFLPTYQEVRNNPSTSYVQSAEKGLNIVEFGYYALNSDANSQRIKYPFGSSSATYWWLRSPGAGYSGLEWRVGGSGDVSSNFAYNSDGVAPCFAF